MSMTSQTLAVIFNIFKMFTFYIVFYDLTPPLSLILVHKFISVPPPFNTINGTWYSYCQVCPCITSVYFSNLMTLFMDSP